MAKQSFILRGALLVAGTAIGAGMLALPVATALGGFLPACIIYLLCWLFMAGTGLLLLEICMWMPRDANIVSMASHLLGKTGRIFSWILYLFLFYCLTVAYAAGGGGFVTAVAGGAIPGWLGILLFMLLFSPFVYLGVRAVDRVNLLLMAGLILSYFVFVATGWGYVDTALLTRMSWPAAFLAMPIIFTSFSFQGIIPSLTAYLQRNPRHVRLAILIGSAIPFLIYVIWEYLILGIVPLEGPTGLLTAQIRGESAVEPLRHFLGSAYIYPVGQAFAFFALTTSFLGVTLGLLDFLADGLKVVKTGKNKIWLSCLVFLPPTLIAILRPGIFLNALSYAGGIGCALLLGLMPVVMVWVGRYYKGFGLFARQFRGGKWSLAFLLCFVLFELFIEFSMTLNSWGK